MLGDARGRPLRVPSVNGSACHPAGRVIGIAGPHAPGGPGAHRARVGLTLPDTHASGDVYEIEPVPGRRLGGSGVMW